MAYRVGIDIGGTFTDLVLIDEAGHVAVDKVPSTPPRFAHSKARSNTRRHPHW